MFSDSSTRSWHRSAWQSRCLLYPLRQWLIINLGGAPVCLRRDIIDNAVNSKDHTTLVAAVKAAGLVETLKRPEPVAIFAPTNAAFDALPEAPSIRCNKPENKEMLTTILTYTIVPVNGMLRLSAR